MDIDKLIRDLKNTAEKHKNDRVFTGGLNVSEMCIDAANGLEYLLEQQRKYLSFLNSVSHELEEIKNMLGINI